MPLNDTMRFCGVPDTAGVAADGQVCKWNKNKITYTIIGQIPGLTDQQTKDAYALAWSYWSAVANVTASLVTDSNTADVVMGNGYIDGPSGVLAWSEMPCGNVTQLQQKFDSSEVWVVADQPAANVIDFVRVACHEIGHVLGMPHIATGNLLAPYYSTTIRKPQAGDIQEMVSRYGPAQTAPTPIAPHPTPVPSPAPSPSVPAIDWSKLLSWLIGVLISKATPAPTPVPTPMPTPAPQPSPGVDWRSILKGLLGSILKGLS